MRGAAMHATRPAGSCCPGRSEMALRRGGLPSTGLLAARRPRCAAAKQGTGGGAGGNGRPSRSALQRRTKAWLEEELARRGVTDAAGTKAVLAARLHEVWKEAAAAAEPASAEAAELAAAGTEGAVDAGAARASSKDLAVAGSTPEGSADPLIETGAASAMDTEKSLRRLRVADLQRELAQLGLPKSGRKEELVERLVQAKLGAVAGAPAAAPRDPAPADTEAKAAPAGAEGTQDLEGALREKIAALQVEIAKREKVLQALQAKLQSAEAAESVDREMLDKMRATISDMEKQREAWQTFLQSSRATLVKTTADDIRVNIRPQLERQLADLEVLAVGLEEEMEVKDGVVQRLTDSLNRSLESSAPEEQDVGKFADDVPAASPTPAAAAPTPPVQAGGGQERKGSRNVGGIGVALAAGVIAVMDGLSMFQAGGKREGDPGGSTRGPE
mmetsp:Transcript_40421/g.104628  ORF Transcript_40421/g.104628 Transcript_40421/m.104628 type:complete len:445 (-) Transcript_40421:53-1387(-)